LLALFADLKVTISPHIHWIAWLVLILPLIVSSIYKRGIVVSPSLWIGVFMFSIGIISSFFYNANLETLIQLIKFLLIFITLYFFLFYSVINWGLIVSVINIAVIINVLLLILGLLGISAVSSLMTIDGRWGTIFVYPGSLVKIGIIGFYINIFALLLYKTKEKFVPLVMVLLSVFIIYMDGSRTGMIAMLVTLPIIPLLYSISNYRDKVKFILFPFILFISFFTLILISLPFLKDFRIGKNILSLIQTPSISSGLELIDPIRYSMYQVAIEKVISSPFLGSGAFSTIGTLEDTGGMVVHNTYLQAWGDFGILGLIGMCSICFGWIVLIPYLLKRIQINYDIKENVLICSSILMLIYFVLNGLFHPYSTEFSEWIMYIIPLTICYTYLKNDSQKVKEKICRNVVEM